MTSPVCFLRATIVAWSPPGAAHELVAVDQGRFAVAAESGSMSLELFFQVLLPDNLSLGRAETDERPAEAEGVDLVAVDRRSAMGMIGAAVDARFPEQFAGCLVEAEDEAIAVLASHRVELAGGNGMLDQAGAEAALLAVVDLPGVPHQRRAFLGPFLEQVLLRGHGIAVRATPLRPILGLLAGNRAHAGAQRQTQGQGQNKTQPFTHKTLPKAEKGAGGCNKEGKERERKTPGTTGPNALFRRAAEDNLPSLAHASGQCDTGPTRERGMVSLAARLISNLNWESSKKQVSKRMRSSLTLQAQFAGCHAHGLAWACFNFQNAFGG